MQPQARRPPHRQVQVAGLLPHNRFKKTIDLNRCHDAFLVAWATSPWFFFYLRHGLVAHATLLLLRDHAFYLRDLYDLLRRGRTREHLEPPVSEQALHPRRQRTLADLVGRRAI